MYEGRDGVSLGSLWRRALFAWSFGDFKLLISDNVTSASKILFRRLIQDRIRRIAPFLRRANDALLGPVSHSDYPPRARGGINP